MNDVNALFNQSILGLVVLVLHNTGVLAVINYSLVGQI